MRARKILPTALWRITGRKLDQLDSVVLLEEMMRIPTHRESQYPGE